MDKVAFTAGFGSKFKDYSRVFKILAADPLIRTMAAGGAVGAGVSGVSHQLADVKKMPGFKRLPSVVELRKKYEEDKKKYASDPQKIQKLDREYKDSIDTEAKKFKNNKLYWAADLMGGALGGAGLAAAIALDGHRRGYGNGSYYQNAHNSSAPSAREAMNTLNLNGVKTKAAAKKAYRDLVKKYHPDRGGDPEMMRKVNNAWDAFSDSHHFQKLAFLKGFLSGC